jgi:hypothetical protein
MPKRVDLPASRQPLTVIQGDAHEVGSRSAAAQGRLAVVLDKRTAYHSTIAHLHAPKITEAEIRCYVSDGARLSYEVFFFLDDGSSETSGPFCKWETALEQARRRAAQCGTPALFSPTKR